MDLNFYLMMCVKNNNFFSFVEMDKSITTFHLRYLWKAGKFFGNELICSKFTNTKAWALSVLSTCGFATVLHTTSFCPFLIESAYYISLATFFLETFGITTRAAELYGHEFYSFFNSFDLSDPDREKQFYGKDV